MASLEWWQSAVFYQIYPRSFADGNGDGIGDLEGVIGRLDYLAGLGIDAIWLSPHYPSPLFDCGYDIADYCAVAPEYGDVLGFERFVEAAHARNIRVILDMVLNHTSDRHAWFRESRSSRKAQRRDWYIWRDGRNGGPPNNWLSGFGGSAWELDEQTGQYYYHFFFKEQPDLNWRNPEVKQAMWQAVRFWLDRGVDGFRLDAIGTIYEDPSLADSDGLMSETQYVRAIGGVTGAKETERYWEEREEMMKQHQLDQPGLHELMRELRAVSDEYPDRMLVGETEEFSYCGEGQDDHELHLVFNFPLMRTSRLTAGWVRQNQERRLEECPPGSWPCNTLGNHDNSRLISHYGDGSHDAEWARLSAALMLTLRGTPFLYYGEEIGMTDLHLDDITQFRDMLGVWLYEALMRHAGRSQAEAFDQAVRFTRDKCRTPMQWSAAPNAGFSPAGVQTWLPVHPNHAAGVNVAEQERDPGSLLNYYRALLRLRREKPALVGGDFTPLGQVDPADECLAFLRIHRDASGQTCLIVLNLGGESHTLDLVEWVRGALGRPEPEFMPQARRLFSSRQFESKPEAGLQNDLSALLIAPYEVYIAEV